jgi:hypothetical protein
MASGVGEVAAVRAQSGNHDAKRAHAAMLRGQKHTLASEPIVRERSNQGRMSGSLIRLQASGLICYSDGPFRRDIISKAFLQ